MTVDKSYVSSLTLHRLISGLNDSTNSAYHSGRPGLLVNTRVVGAPEIYTRTNVKLKADQPRRHVATWSHTLVDQYTRAHKRALEEDPKAHQLTFDYVPPIWLGLYGHLCPIFNIQFSIGLSTKVRMQLWVPRALRRSAIVPIQP